jgi:hypothetical protein
MLPASKHQIVLLHGRGPKPNEEALRGLWIQALRAGLQRDAPEQLPVFDEADIHMVYFAHHLHEFAEPGYDETLDLDNRRQSLQSLMAKQKAKDFRRKHYEALPGKTPLKEFAMDVSASLGLGKAALRKAVPELNHYWDDRQDWSGAVQDRLTTLLTELMAAEKNILLISHCMGSVLAWDSLWHMTHEGEFAGQDVKRITRWITLGSPLGSRAVRSKLAGARESGTRRFPAVLNAWHNISAEDDYVCHDKTVADDFRAMLQQRMIGDIRDHTIYNLSVRYGRSNPHSSAGYLIHPRTAVLLAEWLSA